MKIANILMVGKEGMCLQNEQKPVKDFETGGCQQGEGCRLTAENIDEGEVFYADAIRDPYEAVQSKIRLLRGSFFGRPISRFEVGTVRNVWIPYYYMEYSFLVERNVLFKKRGIKKEGELALVFDMNEMHPFQYDLYESGSLSLKKGKPDIESGEIIECTNDFSEVRIKSEDYIQFRIMKRFYGTDGKLSLKQKLKFYRPAVELEIIYKGQNSNLRYAYLDEFSVKSEHILGLKYRVDNNF